jgi:hypothetical protein
VQRESPFVPEGCQNRGRVGTITYADGTIQPDPDAGKTLTDRLISSQITAAVRSSNLIYCFAFMTIRTWVGSAFGRSTLRPLFGD